MQGLEEMDKQQCHHNYNLNHNEMHGQILKQQREQHLNVSQNDPEKQELGNRRETGQCWQSPSCLFAIGNGLNAIFNHKFKVGRWVNTASVRFPARLSPS